MVTRPTFTTSSCMSVSFDALKSSRALLALGLTAIAAVLAMAGCTGLADKERELVFRIEPGSVVF